MTTCMVYLTMLLLVVLHANQIPDFHWFSMVFGFPVTRKPETLKVGLINQYNKKYISSVAIGGYSNELQRVYIQERGAQTTCEECDMNICQISANGPCTLPLYINPSQLIESIGPSPLFFSYIL